MDQKAGYYLAPVGEVFRGMLPPVTEFAARREIILTDAGRLLSTVLRDGKTLTDLSAGQTEFLAKLLGKKGVMLVPSAARLGITFDELQRMQKCGLLVIRESLRGRRGKSLKIIAWKDGEVAGERAEKDERIRLLLQTEARTASDARNS